MQAEPGRRKGGWRQQHLAAVDVALPESTTLSYLCVSLLSAWADGDSSTVKLLRHAKAAKKDGLNHSMLDAILTVGIVSEQNYLRGLVALFQRAGITELVATIPDPRLVQSWLPPSSIIKCFRSA